MDEKFSLTADRNCIIKLRGSVIVQLQLVIKGNFSSILQAKCAGSLTKLITNKTLKNDAYVKK